jgi:DNA-binding CsgD family transcriptional regulator
MEHMGGDAMTTFDGRSLSKSDTLRTQVREARELYFQVSAELDDLNFDIRSRTHGMVQPDGAQAIQTLAARRRLAFERYQQALSNLTSETLATRPSAPSTKPAVKTGAWPQLTPREVEVLDRIAQGMTSKEIAQDLKISFKTAVTHRTHLMSKFDVGNVALLIRRAIGSGHIKP